MCNWGSDMTRGVEELVLNIECNEHGRVTESQSKSQCWLCGRVLNQIESFAMVIGLIAGYSEYN